MSNSYQKKGKKFWNEYAQNYRRKHPIRYWAQQSLDGHRRRGYLINIKTDELVTIATNHPTCYYCDTPLNFSGDKKRRVWPNSPTVDRRDNGPEMSVGNIDIVCHRCNSTKQGRTHSEFIEYCKKIATRWGE